MTQNCETAGKVFTQVITNQSTVLTFDFIVS